MVMNLFLKIIAARPSFYESKGPLSFSNGSKIGTHKTVSYSDPKLWSVNSGKPKGN